MSENLWALRDKKKMSVAALANRAGLPIGLIVEYEAGQRAIDPRHIGRLARALYVEESEIRLQSDPRPAVARTDRERRREPAPPGTDTGPDQGRPAPFPTAAPDAQRSEAMPGAGSAEATAPAPKPRGRPPRTQPAPRPPAPARASQIAHLDGVLQRLSRSRIELEAQLGKPVAELNRMEMGELLKTLQIEAQAVSVERHRPYLPESVDKYEAKYLADAQAAGATLYFALFDGRSMSGQVIGFGPYSITMRQADGTEVTLYKLGLISYAKAPGQEAGT